MEQKVLGQTNTSVKENTKPKRDPQRVPFSDSLGLSPLHFSKKRSMKSFLLRRLTTYLLELGMGFSLAYINKRLLCLGAKEKVDLVFYHIPSRRFVLVNLISGSLSPKEVGKMDSYLRWFDAREKTKEGQPSMGILLSAEVDESVLRYSAIADDPRRIRGICYPSNFPTLSDLENVVRQQKALFATLGNEHRE